MFDDTMRDLRHAARQLIRTPGLTIVMTLTLAVGIGATTAIFSLVHSVVLRPLPFDEPGRLVRVYATSDVATSADEVSPRRFAAWRTEANAFAGLGAVERRGFTLSGEEGEAEHVVGARATASLLELLGVRMQLGRAFGETEDQPGAARVVVLELDPELAFSDARTLDERVASLLALTRFNTRLLTGLGLTALALSLIGIYGVVAYLVTQRTQELAVRIALGATPPRIIRMLIRQGLMPVIMGIAAGVALALALSRLIENQLYGVTGNDPITLATVMLAMLLTAAAAAAVPAWRATRLEPRDALEM